MIRTIAIFMLLFLPLLSQAAEKPKPYAFVPLFPITKTVNKNVVKYEAAVTQDCKFMKDEPFKIEWLMGNQTIEGLNFFERRLYPVDILTRTDQQIVGEIKAFKKKGLNYPISFTVGIVNGKCTGAVSSQDVALLASVHLSDFDGREPTAVTIIGFDDDGLILEKEILSTLVPKKK
jgi:hypothetical protein